MHLFVCIGFFLCVCVYMFIDVCVCMCVFVLDTLSYVTTIKERP